MKIVIIGPAFPLRGGIAAFTERLANEFFKTNKEVEIVTYSLQYPKLLFPGKTQFSTSQNSCRVPIRVALNSINPFNWIALGKQIQKEAPDLVIFKFWMPFMAPALGSLARIIQKNKKSLCIALAHNVFPHEKRLGDKNLVRYFAKAMDGFMVLSESVKKDLESFGFNKPIKLSPHPLYDHYGERMDRSGALMKLKLDADWNYLLFFGLIRDYKGLDLALKAMASPKLKEMKLKMIVAGEFYGDSKHYFDLINSLGIQDRLLFHSKFIPDDWVSAYFSAASLVVQPYREATQSGVTQIAYHYNKPILVTDVGGLSELVPHQKVGYVSSRNPEEIATYILDYFEQEREAEFSANIKEVKKKYSWEKFLISFNDLVAEIQKKR
jgi:glycosyltransferase involved in cell wall biosynthesis